MAGSVRIREAAAEAAEFYSEDVGAAFVITQARAAGTTLDRPEALRLIEEARQAQRTNGRRTSGRGGDLARALEAAATTPPPATGADEDGLTLTDTGNSSRLIHLHGDRLRFIPSWGRWIVWPPDGTGRWIVDHRDVHVRELAKDVGLALKQQAAIETDGDAAKRLFAFGLKSLSAAAIRSMVELARGIEGVVLDHEELDTDGWLLGVRNGVIDLETGEIRDSDPADLMTLQAPVEYDPAAEAPRWRQAMGEWFPDPDVRAYVQRLSGAACVGEQLDHVFVIHYGAGRNGKGTFVRALQAVLGPYAAVPHLGLLVQQKYQQHDTVKADLFRARLAVASETQQRVKLDEASVKNLTGGDRITARRMREDPWEFDPTHSLWLQTNHLPEIAGRDRGIWSRIRVVKWENTFEGDEDKQLDEKLAAEAPGILRWLVEGCLAWQEHGLDEPEAVIRETLAYRESEDTFARFAHDMGLEFSSDLEIQGGDLQELLDDWSEAEGVDVPKKDIGNWLRDMGATRKRKRVPTPDGGRRQVRVWEGVGVQEDTTRREELYVAD